MKVKTEYLNLKTDTRYAFVNITSRVSKIIEESKIQEGLCLVNTMHISSSIFINDNEDGLHEDFRKWLEDLAPHNPINQYRHNDTGEDNADAHLKRQIMGREVVIAITNGKPDFGPWEQIFYGEFDGQRNKKILIKLIGE
jgi:secondary thiamine-phosphate synthase enzyme